MEACHNLPLDILRLLFEFSASASLACARILSLVSKEIQLWFMAFYPHSHVFTYTPFIPIRRTDPHLFQIVQGHVISSGNPTGSSLDMLLFNSSPRIVRARNFVRVVAFPSLTQLCLWRTFFPHKQHTHSLLAKIFEINERFPSLRRLATCIHRRSNLPLNAFKTPFWMTITHLQVRNNHGISSPDSPFQLPLFAAMSSLTCLALSVTAKENEHDIGFALSRVRGTFPPSLILCILALRAPTDINYEDWLTEIVSTGLRVDDRIVLRSTASGDNAAEIVVSNGSDSFQEWCGVQDGIQTFWEMGKAVLSRRRERLRAV
ncbi:hypothetical protein DL96DRAFT_1595995 [Flagelloscypha sp. PMI_526]|nr:hypothetical protein DL96DRAFT_1595995 [Flagelloscypha sp. PMI_526]